MSNANANKLTWASTSPTVAPKSFSIDSKVFDLNFVCPLFSCCFIWRKNATLKVPHKYFLFECDKSLFDVLNSLVVQTQPIREKRE